MNWHLVLAFALALLLPAALIATGVELRRVRLRIVEDLLDTVFKGDRDRDLPQINLALARYGHLPRDMVRDSRPSRQDEVRQWTGAVLYALVSFAGFALLFDPVRMLIDAAGGLLSVTDALFWLPEETKAAEIPGALRRTAAIAGVAFLGGYIFNMRYLIRQTLNQELSALAFVRAALRLVQGMILAVVAYHIGATALPSPEAASVATGTASPGFAAGLGVAFLLGYLPDLGLARVAQVVRLRIKAVDERAYQNARIIPLEIIDGIDHEIAFRLQESNLYDIQNLAVMNPIELYAETPYSLLQTFDWVLQAQLCLVVGSGAFEQLKKHKIRTIFDLERAILAKGVPEAYLRGLASVLLSDASGCFRQAIGLSAKYEDCEAEQDAPGITIRHLVAIISDDLHVHRLRALWTAIMNSTAGTTQSGRSLWLFETEWLPGEPATAT